MQERTNMNEVIKIEQFPGLSADENIRLNTIKHQITTTTENFLTDVGAYFKEAQDILSKNKTGVFRSFIQECGYNHDTVYKMINRYNLIVSNADNIDYLETLPTRVLAAAGAKNAPPELTQAVINGDIQTMKELDEFKTKYRAQMQRTMELSNRLAETTEQIATLEQQLKTGIKEVVVDEQAIDAAVDEATKEYQVELERKIEEMRRNELLMEDKENAISEMQSKLRKNENIISTLQAELNTLLPLKEKSEEIEKLKKQLSKYQEEIRNINLDFDIYKALRVAKESLHRDILTLATIVRTPKEVASNIKDDIRAIHELMQNFIIATTEKFQLNR